MAKEVSGSCVNPVVSDARVRATDCGLRARAPRALCHACRSFGWRAPPKRPTKRVACPRGGVPPVTEHPGPQGSTPRRHRPIHRPLGPGMRPGTCPVGPSTRYPPHRTEHRQSQNMWALRWSRSECWCGPVCPALLGAAGRAVPAVRARECGPQASKGRVDVRVHDISGPLGPHPRAPVCR